MGWASSNGESKVVCPDESLSVDGIHNCIRVLEEIENNKFSDLVFFEGNACVGGCVGGPLVYENNYVAKNNIRKLVSAIKAKENINPVETVPASVMNKYAMHMDAPIEPNPVMQLDDDIQIAMEKMTRMNQIIERLPGYDCGSCGSPTCRAFAEDIVRGYFTENACIHKMREQIKRMAQQMIDLAQISSYEEKK